MEPTESKIIAYRLGAQPRDISMTQYLIRTRVARVEEKFLTIYKNLEDAKTDSQVEKERQSIGWFIRMEGSSEYLHLGFEKPELEAGDKVEIMIRKQA